MRVLSFLKRRLIYAFAYSLAGLRSAWQTEEAIKFEACLLPVLIAIAINFGNSNIEKALLISSSLLVLIVELLNTGLEKAIDRVSMDYHELSKVVKDIGSAAVLLSMINFLITWALILM
ncbi:diacylglycerol kinase [Polynucleobacter sp. MWH-Loch1C5]|nr:diacylglycerol kinase [Polynucleobacter sp. MWH-Loch1C5]